MNIQEQLEAAWSDSVDQTTFAHAKPAAMAKGTLFVTVDTNARLDEIVRSRREILQLVETATYKPHQLSSGVNDTMNAEQFEIVLRPLKGWPRPPV